VAIGLDASVVLRLLIGEPRSHVEIARRRIELAMSAGDRVVVADLVVAETFHALRHHYGVPETVALTRLREFLGSGVVSTDPAGGVEALAPAVPARTGVVDRLIVARYRSLGALTATFDRRQARLEGGVLLRGGG
jgi:predicted nucleic acid-binding protein